MLSTGGPRPERAAAGDEVHLHKLRRQLEDWLHDKDIRQWPRGEVSLDLIARQIQQGQWRILRDRRVGVAAAMRVLWSDPDFWGDDDADAVYVHGLMVDRAVAGRDLGRSMLEAAAQLGRRRGSTLLRLDCAETNHALRRYYANRGFHEVGRRDFADLFSVTLFEKRITLDT